MPSNLKLSPLARSDIRDILTYTQKRYGTEQRQTYSDFILKAIETIADNPDIGHIRPDIPPICAVFFSGASFEHFPMLLAKSRGDIRGAQALSRHKALKLSISTMIIVTFGRSTQVMHSLIYWIDFGSGKKAAGEI